MSRREVIVRLSEVARLARQAITWAGAERRWFFYGGVGSGKTTFIRAVCRGLAVRDNITSPTFSLLHEYGDEDTLCYHFDLYRINSPLEACDLGIVEYLESRAYCFVEWAERIPTLLPTPRIELHFEVLDSAHRRVVWRAL